MAFEKFYNYDAPRHGLGLRVAQAFFAIITLGLTASTVHDIQGGGAAAYLLFVSLLTLLALAYLVFAPIYYPKFIHFWVFFPFVVDLVLNVFWFTGFIAMAAIYGPYSCSAFGYYGGYYYYYGSSRWSSGCKTGKAAIAMAAITWILFILSSIFLGLQTFRHAGTSATAASGQPADAEKAVVPPPQEGTELEEHPEAVQPPDVTPAEVEQPVAQPEPVLTVAATPAEIPAATADAPDLSPETDTARPQ
ncbi:membrane-associating domain-containing protein [Lipomyces japonicus]|uniref:membrane-associating domain-containing protein n=1 Tax=Lipomyces japonicus TaxID=56871 RepID=UPI0034D00818